MRLRFAALVLALCLLTGCALAQPAVEGTPVSGERYAPEGATAETARLVFRYRYPQFEDGSDADRSINAYFAALAQDLESTLIPQALASTDALPEEGMPPYSTEIDYRISCSTDDYLSVQLMNYEFRGNAESTSLTAATFARSGVYAGQMIELSQVMGWEQAEGETSDFTSELVLRLVWDIIEQQRAAGQLDYLDDLTRDDLTAAFSPETDFYLDESGNPVFFVQAGTVVAEVSGVMTFPFSVAELLSAVKES